MQKQTPDPIYLLEDQKLREDSDESYFFYQQHDVKKEKWKVASSRQLPSQVALHSALWLTVKPVGEPSHPDFAAIPRVGAYYADFDDAANPSQAVGEAQVFVKKLIDLGVPPAAIHPFVSGEKGAGLYVDSRVFGERATAGHPRLALAYKEVTFELAKGMNSIDLSIYNLRKGRLTRRLNRQRSNKKFRSLVPVEEFMASTSEQLLERSSSAGVPLVYPETISQVEGLVNLFSRAVAKLEASQNVPLVREPNSLISQESPSNLLQNEGEEFKCLSVFNKCNRKDFDQGSNFHRLVYLLAGLLALVSDLEAVQKIMGFLSGWTWSASYPDQNARQEHFLAQRETVKKENYSRLPCAAIRKALVNPPCFSCRHFREDRRVMGRQVVATRTGLAVQKVDGKGITRELFISNGSPQLVRRETIFDLDNGSRCGELVFSIHTAQRVYYFNIPADQLSNSQLILQTINAVTGGRVQIEKSYFDLFMNYALQNEEVEEEKMFSDTGFNRAGGFVFPNGLVAKGEIEVFGNPIVYGSENGFIKKLRWAQLSLADVPKLVCKWFKGILKFHQPGPSSVVLGHVLAPVIAGLLGLQYKYFLSLVGPSGDGKTTLVRALMNLFGDHWDLESFISASSTANMIEVQGSKFRHLPYVIDDFKEANVSSVSAFRRILQNCTDGSSRGRLTADSTVKESTPIRGYPLVTAEDSPVGTETSLLGRSLEVQSGPIFTTPEIIAQVESLKDQMPGVLPHFIASLQGSGVAAKLKTRFEALVADFSKLVSAGSNRERIVKSLALNHLSVETFFNWISNAAGKEGCLEIKELAEGIVTLNKIHLIEMGNVQTSEAKAIIPGNTFLRGLADAVLSRRCDLLPFASLHNPFDSQPERPVIGYGGDPMDEETEAKDLIYLIPGPAVGVAKDQLIKTGSSLDFSTKAISTSLDRAGFLKKKDNGRNTKKIRVGNQSFDFWVISRAALFPSASTSDEVAPEDEA